jgi:hypothetical protein
VENALTELLAPTTFLIEFQLLCTEFGRLTIVTAPGETATVCVNVGELTGYSTVTLVATSLVRCNSIVLVPEKFGRKPRINSGPELSIAFRFKLRNTKHNISAKNRRSLMSFINTPYIRKNYNYILNNNLVRERRLNKLKRYIKKKFNTI